MTVIDASAVIDLLLPKDVARRDRLAASLPQPLQPWLAPDVLPFEVASVIRRQARLEMLAEPIESRALERLIRFPIELISTEDLIPRAAKLGGNFSTSATLYVALALGVREPLLTTDAQLAQAAGHAGAEVCLV